MTAAKSDVLRKRLLSAGLSPDICTKYIEILRAFLNARLTKSSYEDQMLKVLPKDKIHVHNSIIQEILYRAQQKRPGLPDLPIVQNPKKLPPVRRAPPQKIPNGPIPSEKKKIIKRQHDEVDTDSRKPSQLEDGTVPSLPKKPKLNPRIPKKMEVEKPPSTKPRPVEKPSPKLPKSVRKQSEAPTVARPTAGGQATRMQPPKTQAQAQSVEIATYEGLPYFPVRPGHGVDFEFFLKLRHRMRRIVMEQVGGMTGVKDDAVALLVHGVEHHIKTLLAAGARKRAARDGIRPQRNLQCGPVRGYDFRESAKQNPGLFGDEFSMELERLSLLL